MIRRSTINSEDIANPFGVLVYREERPWIVVGTGTRDIRET